MPKFHVEKGHDAWQRYATIVEADTVEEAERIAGQRDYSGEWVRSGVSEYDDWKILEGDSERVDDLFELEATTEIDLTDPERNTILAALRFYQHKGQGNPMNRSELIHEIATNNGAVVSLEDSAINRLCEKINA